MAVTIARVPAYFTLFPPAPGPTKATQIGPDGCLDIQWVTLQEIKPELREPKSFYLCFRVGHSIFPGIFTIPISLKR